MTCVAHYSHCGEKHGQHCLSCHFWLSEPERWMVIVEMHDRTVAIGPAESCVAEAAYREQKERILPNEQVRLVQVLESFEKRRP